MEHSTHCQCPQTPAAVLPGRRRRGSRDAEQLVQGKASLRSSAEAERDGLGLSCPRQLGPGGVAASRPAAGRAPGAASLCSRTERWLCPMMSWHREGSAGGYRALEQVALHQLVFFCPLVVASSARGRGPLPGAS